jgi:ketosteroid isomerase-like protein
MTKEATLSEQNVQVVQGIYRAFASRDIPAFLGALSPDVEWISPESLPYGGTYVGPQAVGEQYFGGFMTHVGDDFRLEAERFIDAGDDVVVVARLSGRARETGAEFDAPSLQVWSLHDGKVSALRYLIDTAQVIRAIEGQPAG